RLAVPFGQPLLDRCVERFDAAVIERASIGDAEQRTGQALERIQRIARDTVPVALDQQRTTVQDEQRDAVLGLGLARRLLEQRGIDAEWIRRRRRNIRRIAAGDRDGRY